MNSWKSTQQKMCFDWNMFTTRVHPVLICMTKLLTRYRMKIPVHIENKMNTLSRKFIYAYNENCKLVLMNYRTQN